DLIVTGVQTCALPIYPAVDVLGRIGEKTGVIVPIYPQSGKADVSTWQLQKLVAESLRRARDFDDPVPPELLDRLGLTDRTRAYRSEERRVGDGRRSQR